MKAVLSLIGPALRTLRETAELSQRTVARRTHAPAWPFGPLTADRISGYERSKALPSAPSLLCILVACSPDGATLDLAPFHEALRQRVASSKTPSLKALLATTSATTESEPGVEIMLLKLKVGDLEARLRRLEQARAIDALDWREPRK